MWRPWVTSFMNNLLIYLCTMLSPTWPTIPLSCIEVIGTRLDQLPVPSSEPPSSYTRFRTLSSSLIGHPNFEFLFINLYCTFTELGFLVIPFAGSLPVVTRLPVHRHRGDYDWSPPHFLPCRCPLRPVPDNSGDDVFPLVRSSSKRTGYNLKKHRNPWLLNLLVNAKGSN